MQYCDFTERCFAFLRLLRINMNNATASALTNSIVGTSTVTLSNPTLTLHHDGNVVTATRSDTGGLININVGTASTNEELQPILDAAALQLAQQNAVGAALVQMVYSGTVSSEHGETTVVLHPYYSKSNLDGLVITYTLSTAETLLYNVNVGTCPGTEQTDLNDFGEAASMLLQNTVDGAAQRQRDLEDAAIGISDVEGSGTASVTL